MNGQNPRRPLLSCDPPFWAQGGHLQTIAGQFLPYTIPELPWQNHRLKLKDGDALALQSLEGTTGVAIHLFHGMAGSTQGHYMRRAAARFHARGHAVLAVNHRGAGQGMGWSRDFYHGGSTADMATALHFGRERFPGQLQVAIGYSISASILLLLLGRDASEGVPDRAIAVNPPADLEACSRRLATGLNLLYDQYFIRRIRREVQTRLGATSLIPTRTTRDFDSAYAAAMAGFPDRDTYYAQCSCGPHLGNIRVPTVILTSRDDPFAPAGDILKQAIAPAVHVHVERSGGHMGYVSGNLPDRRWLDYALEHYLNEFRPAQEDRAFLEQSA
jgi:predicted alpha/beta-fold hydrolase